MSYDIRLGVKVEGMNGYIATIDEPQYSSPTYNLRDMFVACTGWNYEQGIWYNCAEIYPKIQHGIQELATHPKKYAKYNASNGWGTVADAKECLESVSEKIAEIIRGDTWSEIPLEHLWMRW